MLRKVFFFLYFFTYIEAVFDSLRSESNNDNPLNA